MLGIHIDSNPKDLIYNADKAKNMGSNIIQLFVHINKKYRNHYNLLKDFLVKNNMACVVHISYTINIAKEWNNYSWWINKFIMEIKIAGFIGAIAVIIHIGKDKDYSSNIIDIMTSTLIYVNNQTNKYKNVKILIETSSGQGNELCYKIDELALLFNKLGNIKRFCLCIDTCHIFASGIDIRTKENVNEFIKLFDNLIGIKNIGLIHLNDSKRELGMKVDRHENIGAGFIGKIGLIYIYKLFMKYNVPVILETPSDNYITDLKILTT